MTDAVAAYIAANPHAAALRDLRALLRDLLADHIECMSYAMPGFRAPGGKMVIGYAGFARHIGLYPHSGSVIAKIDCAPYKTSKSGITFAPDDLPPRALIAQIITARHAELAAGY